jgi:hypothetical protein
MKTLSFWFACAVLALFTAAASAADVSGTWTAEVPGRGGQTRTQTFTFKVDGNTLTGTVSGPRGETPISDGKINGDEISFSVVREFNGNTFRMNYTGKVSGDEIQFKASPAGGPGGGRGGRGGRGMEFTAKRSST